MLTTLQSTLASHHLQVLGHCPVQPADGLGDSGTIVLVGPDEPRFWSYFQRSPEYSDGHSDPMDRWSRRILQDVAARQAAKALFPFDGPPFLPFFQFALRSNRFWPSPIQMLVHDTCGLFVSFRGAIVLRDVLPAPARQTAPCVNCPTQPCRTACPVNAFAPTYDVRACKGHLDTAAGSDCVDQGCLARRVCPVGQGQRLAAQVSFHMKAFL